MSLHRSYLGAAQVFAAEIGFGFRGIFGRLAFAEGLSVGSAGGWS